MLMAAGDMDYVELLESMGQTGPKRLTIFENVNQEYY
jgi:hypothetical protein